MAEGIQGCHPQESSWPLRRRVFFVWQESVPRCAGWHCQEALEVARNIPWECESEQVLQSWLQASRHWQGYSSQGTRPDEFKVEWVAWPLLHEAQIPLKETQRHRSHPHWYRKVEKNEGRRAIRFPLSTIPIQRFSIVRWSRICHLI